MSQGPFIRHICNNPSNPRATSVNDSEISGAKRTEFCLQTSQFTGLKPYITSSALNRSIKGHQTKLNGYTPEITTLRAARPKYKGLHPKNKQFKLKEWHTNQMGGAYDHTYLNAFERL